MTVSPTSNNNEPSGNVSRPPVGEEQQGQQDAADESQERNATSPPQSTNTTSARLSPSDPPGFEINLGPITVVFDPHNVYQLSMAVSIISTLLLARILRDLRVYKQYSRDQAAIEKAQKSFGAKIDRLPDNITINFPDKKPGLIERVFRRENNEHQETMLLVLSIREDLTKFVQEYRGQLHKDLEDGTLHLLEVSSKQELYTPEIYAAMERFATLAERSKELLSGNSIHYARFVTKQFAKTLKKN